ncbi:MAG: glycosyltransferase family protein [Flavobacteriales bacterium]
MKVLVAPLNWGIGHASRSSVLIEQHLQKGHQVLIASSGTALMFLKRRLPNLQFFELPDYQITYHKSRPVWLSVLFGLKTLSSAIKKEQKVIQKLQNIHKFDLIISDNRYGVYHNSVKSIFVCHQLVPKAPFGHRLFKTFIEAIHRNYIKGFDELYIPDYQSPETKLSGDLNQLQLHWKQNQNYIQPLSHLKLKNQAGEANRILVLLSGVEPKRSQLEHQLMHLFSSGFEAYSLCFVGGSLEKTTLETHSKSIEYHSFLDKQDLENQINKASVIICRSGYSTLMDLHELNRKHIILIPTKGQTEQDYLAAYLENKFSHFSALESSELKKMTSISLKEKLKSVI